MRHRPTRALAVLFLFAGLVAGCGGGSSDQASEPRLPAAVGEELAAQSELVAGSLERGDTCAAAAQAAGLLQSTIDAINRGDVPSELQEELTSGVNGLVAEIRCVPPPQPTSDGDEDERDDGDD